MGISGGQPNTNDYNIGRGIIYFASVDANGFPKEYRDLGNATEFTLSFESERIEHQSSRAGLKVTDKEVVISQSMSIGFTIDEINFDNLALFMSGNTATRTQAVQSVLGTKNVHMSGKGRWYDLFDTADLTSGYPPTANMSTKRVYNLDAISQVQITAAGAVLVLGTDYLVDLKMGRIFILSTATAAGLTGTSQLDVDFAQDATVAIDEVHALTAAEISGALKFISDNPANNGFKRQYQFHSVTVSAEGDFSLIGDEFSTMSFTGKAEKRENVDGTSPTLRITDFVQ